MFQAKSNYGQQNKQALMAAIKQEAVLFPTSLSEILDRVDSFDPNAYGRTRNYIDGAISYLSPYISRGVISTKYVLTRLLNKGYDPKKIEKYIQELAWRDYWQQIWLAKGEQIDSDLKHTQTPVANKGVPKAIIEGKTGIEAIDSAVDKFYQTGYIHNHVRMYIASICTNIGHAHWKLPAQWMYYHLLDADWASNALSWQWVAGTNSNKKYYANQENINMFCQSKQHKTFLDIGYDAFATISIPEILKQVDFPNFCTSLPKTGSINIERNLPTCIYNAYNLDPFWRNKFCANRVLLLEPSHFRRYPMSEKTINFILNLAKNIEGIQIYIGEFKDLISTFELNEVYYKEHPTSTHYTEIEDQRDWMFDVKGYFPSFFSFWKKCRKQLQ